jgi:hypothetical protein
MWGILEQGVWRAEQRVQIQTDPYILEEVIPYASCHAPPPTVDDIWEEEIVRVGDLEYNGSFVTVCLPGTILKQWCIKQNLPVPSIPDSMPSVTPQLLLPKPQSLPQSLPKQQHNKPYTKQYPNSQKLHTTNRNMQSSRPFKPKCFIED